MHDVDNVVVGDLHESRVLVDAHEAYHNRDRETFHRVTMECSYTMAVILRGLKLIHRSHHATFTVINPEFPANQIKKYVAMTSKVCLYVQIVGRMAFWCLANKSKPTLMEDRQ